MDQAGALSPEATDPTAAAAPIHKAAAIEPIMSLFSRMAAAQRSSDRRAAEKTRTTQLKTTNGLTTTGSTTTAIGIAITSSSNS